MNKEELATLLNGRQYGQETSKNEEDLARKDGLLIVFGASDDLVELRGIIYDEIDAFGGGKFAVKFSKKKECFKMCSPKKSENRIEAVWSPDELECSWLIKTDLPHATFDIMEDGELYCRGIVVDAVDFK